MIGYVTLGTNDMNRAGRFYDDLLTVVGAKRTMETEKFIAWGNNPQARKALSDTENSTPIEH